MKLTLSQYHLVLDFFLLFHYDTEIMIFAFFWSFHFNELLGNVQPIAKATFHDTLNKHDFLLSRPISHEKREVHVVKDKVIVAWFVRMLMWVELILLWGMFWDSTESKTLKTHKKVELWRAIKTANLHTF